MAELMKGHVWAERKDAVDRKGNPIVTYPVYAEVKHDEIRCHVIVDAYSVQFLSYSGKPLANMQEFAHLFVGLSKDTGYNEFDCGFEVNGNFNDSYRWVRSTKALPTDLKDKPCTIQFYLFDLPESECQFHARNLQRYAVVDEAGTWLSVPKGEVCPTEACVDAAYTRARAAGEEGLMIKQFGHTYQRGKRTDGWLKMKPENDADGVVIALHEAVCGKDQPDLGLMAGDPLGRTGSVTIRMPDGSEASPHGIPHDLGVEMHMNPQAYIGQWAEFNYMERDRQGGYRHPTWGRLREAKE